VGLYDDAVMRPAIEGVADSVGVWQEAVRADLRCPNDALAQILDKEVAVLAIALAGAIGDDGLSGSAHANERIHVTLLADLMSLHALLLLADVGPKLIKLEAASADTDHHAIMKLGAATANTSAKAHDGVAVNASQSLNGPDAHAFGQAGNDGELFV